MPNATQELLKTHRMIRKVLEKFSVKNQRFPAVTKTLHRAVLAHNWFGDEIFFPAVEKVGFAEKCFMAELRQEHRDLARLLTIIGQMSPETRAKSAAVILQFRTVLEAHFRKEEGALYPLAEEALDAGALKKLGNDMARRSVEVRDLTVLPGDAPLLEAVI